MLKFDADNKKIHLAALHSYSYGKNKGIFVDYAVEYIYLRMPLQRACSCSFDCAYQYVALVRQLMRALDRTRSSILIDHQYLLNKTIVINVQSEWNLDCAWDTEDGRRMPGSSSLKGFE